MARWRIGLIVPQQIFVAAGGGIPVWSAAPNEQKGANHVHPHLLLRSERFTGLAFSRSFQCKHCGVAVSTDAPGTAHRNHCPSCLWSQHLDRNAPGDRDAKCSGGMEPIAVTVRGEGRWVLVHRCTNCGRLRLNRTAGDDNALLLMQIAALPLTMPPFPFQRLQAAGEQ